MNSETQVNLPNSLEEHWMPFTSNQDYKDNPRLMVSASGMYYKDHHNNKLIDASSGLFCNPAGHNRPEIKEAVTKDATKEIAAPINHPKTTHNALPSFL